MIEFGHMEWKPRHQRARDAVDARETPTGATRDDANDANDDGNTLARTHDDDDDDDDVKVADGDAKKFSRALEWWWWIRVESDA